MIQLRLDHPADEPLQIVCLGAHSDDIEIGCGGTLLTLARRYPRAVFRWAVFNAVGVRKKEAIRAAKLFAGPGLETPVLKSFRDGFMPYEGGKIKSLFEEFKRNWSPDLIFCPWHQDAHQDHRLIAELTWNTFRNHVILEYEIPKYDGDLGRPAVFVALHTKTYQRKVRYLLETFQSQQQKRWFEASTFSSLMRLRGMECNAESGYAEGFHCRKLVL
jgi:LmbE family N-acetylglucosaminyl deacetylase